MKASIIDMPQNMPEPETLSNIVSGFSENINAMSSVASTIENLFRPLSEMSQSISDMMDRVIAFPDWIEKVGSSFLFMEKMAIPMDGFIKAAMVPYSDGIASLISAFDDKDLPSSTPQPLSALPLFKSPLGEDTCSSPKMFRDEASSLSETNRFRLECIIRNCYFESGTWTEADEYFSSLWDEQGNRSLEILSDIVNTHLDDEHMLEGVLHILSSLPYPQIAPTGISIAIACGFNHSPLVIDQLITCFEDWEDPAAINVLAGMNLKDLPWLSNYRDDVIEMLQGKA